MVLAALVALTLVGCGGEQAARRGAGQGGDASGPQALDGQRADEAAQGREVLASPALATALVRLRVYADQDVRLRQERWEEDFRGLVDRTNVIAGPRFGVRFEVVEFVSWVRRCEVSDLEACLVELERLDDVSAGADRVVGVLEASPNASDSMQQLGEARYLGRHLVMRALDDRVEAEASSVTLDEWPEQERAEKLDERRRHKQVAMFLHQWARSLGAVRVERERCWMASLYSPAQAEFCQANAELLRTALAHPRPHRSPERLAALRQAVRLHLRESPHQDQWLPGARASALTSLEEGAGNLMPAEVQAFQDAVALLQARAPRDAWPIAAALARAHPEHPDVQALACDVSAGIGDPGGPVLQHCFKAARLNPAAPRPVLMLASAHIARGDWPQATGALIEARNRHVALPQRDPATALFIAKLASSAFLVTLTEELAGRHPDYPQAAELLGWASRTRMRYGLPTQSAEVAPVQEGVFLRLMEALQRHTFERNFAAADATVAALIDRFPQAPGTYAARCALHSARNQTRLAVKACDDALKRHPECTAALHLRAELHLRQRQAPMARRRLRKALMLDPDASYHWLALAQLLTKPRDRQALETLRSDFSAHFRQPPPF